MENTKCNVCGESHEKRVDLNIKCSEMEAESFKLLHNKITCANQALSPASIPNGVHNDKIRIYLTTVLESLSNYKFLEQNWWDTCINKYSLPKNKNIYIDFNSRDFYYFDEE